jgi:hypothetical protein
MLGVEGSEGERMRRWEEAGCRIVSIDWMPFQDELCSCSRPVGRFGEGALL